MSSISIKLTECDAYVTDTRTFTDTINKDNKYCCQSCNKDTPFDEWNFFNNSCLHCTWKDIGCNSAGRFSYQYETSDGYTAIKTCPEDLSSFKYEKCTLDEIKNIPGIVFRP